MISSATVFSPSRESTDWAVQAAAKGLDMNALPRHVAIIMDGNGRWAAQRHLPLQFGHRQGVEAVRRAVRAVHGLGIGALTIYSFSTENWKRPPSEVEALMGLLRMFIRADLEDLRSNNIQIVIIGEREGIPSDIAKLLLEAEETTRGNTGPKLVIAFNYGARAELVSAAQAMARDAAAGLIAPEDIDEALFASRLGTADIRDPDLLIRTSGEQRLSNFLLWQCAYTEFVFQDVLWPDFTGEHLIDAIATYQRRDRRYGGRTDGVESHTLAGSGP